MKDEQIEDASSLQPVSGDDLRQLAEKLQTPDIRREVLKTCDSYDRTKKNIDQTLAAMRAADRAQGKIGPSLTKGPTLPRVSLPLPPLKELDTAWIADLLVIPAHHQGKEVPAHDHEESEDESCDNGSSREES